MDKNQLRTEIIDPALRLLNHYSQEASDLLLGTAGIETNFAQTRVQKGGPALGIFQMEPDTLFSLWDNYIKYRPDIFTRLRDASGNYELQINAHPDPQLLVTNDRFAAAMCRIKYLDCKGSIPQPNEPNYAAKLVGYYKEYYNTPKGACTLKQAEEVFKQIVGD